MKAILYRSVPPGHVVDLAHDLAPHRIAEAAFLVRAMARGFPSGSVHVAVVDPGVGGRRAPVAVRCQEGSLLVGPDNGVLSLLADELRVARVVRLSPGLVVPGQSPSPTFEGRDLFAPAAARLALGGRLDSLGRRTVLHRLPVASPTRTGRRIDGEIVHIDRFGNVITNIPGDWGARVPPTTLRVGQGPFRSVRPVRTYEELSPRELGLLVSSFGLLEVCVREGSAARTLRASVGDGVAVVLGRGGVHDSAARPKRRKRSGGTP